jgi:hypothetical protein
MGFRLVIADHVRFPCVHAAATTPAQRLNVSLRSFRPDVSVFPERLSGRPAHCPFRGLLGVHSRCGLHTRAVTNSWHANRRLQPLRYLHDCSDCFRLELLPGGLHALESAAFARRTPRTDIRAVARYTAWKFVKSLIVFPVPPQSPNWAIGRSHCMPLMAIVG